MFLIIILQYAVTLLPLFNKTVTKNLTKTKIFFFLWKLLAYLVVLKNQQGSTFKTIAKNLRRVEEKASFDAFPFSQVKNASK